MTAGIAMETRLATLAFRTAQAPLISVTTAPSVAVALSVEFFEYPDRHRKLYLADRPKVVTRARCRSAASILHPQ
jgi:hypothetical protein